jgi:uncharacterized membrane protein YeiB
VSEPSLRRLGFLDAARGIVVVGMLFANLINVFLRRVPGVLSHNWGDRLRFFDFPAPVFQFLLGVSLVLFLDRRIAGGRAPLSAGWAAVRRFLLLVALGLVLDGIGSLKGSPQWGVLQTLGLGGIVATVLSGASDRVLVAVSLGMLGLYSGFANGDVHHDPTAALAFVPLTLGGVLVGRGLTGPDPRAAFIKRTAILGAVSATLAWVARAAGIPFNKVHGTSSFVALSAAMSAILLLFACGRERRWPQFPDWLLILGSNALTAWVLQYVLVYYPAWLLFPSWRRLKLVPGLAAAAVAVFLLSTLTIALGKRNIRLPI